MASSSSSFIHKTSFKYDVFISFRGEDTRTSFVDHLYHALKHENIETYKDDENLERGKKISKELIQAIKDSRFHVIVFSKNYASSSWCLDELVKIIECQKTPTEHIVYPIFYRVEPTEVRKQSGEFGKAFSEHKNDEASRKWKEALIEATSLSGRELRTTADGHEAEFIKLVIKEISSRLPTVCADGNLIGMRSRINDVVSFLNTFTDEICMIGLTGMGGSGKTTLARAVFDHISNEFEGSSFVENVQEFSNSLEFGLKSLQQQVLRGVLNKKDIIKGSFVLDDVDHIDQLKALAGEPNWFKSGSRIIITTRDKQVLIAHKVNLIHDVNLLTDKEAICLLSRCAFGTEIPSPEYKELSEKVVSSSLCDADEDVWIDTLEELEKIPLDGTLQRLELSYKGLDTNCREIFLHVACILKTWTKERVIKVLESCGYHAKRGLKKSLITTRDGYLDMHHHIQEMGRYIVRRLHFEEPNKHSRLWIERKLLIYLLGTNEAIRCIKLISSELNPEIVMKGLRNMKQLRFLQVFDRELFKKNWRIDEDEDCFQRNWKPDEVCEYFPNTLRWLAWQGYPFKSLPKSFQANNLVALEMSCSKLVQLWECTNKKVLNKLKFLDLRHSKLKNLDLGLTPNLETLSLIGCSDLVELRMHVECPKLIYLELGNSKLTTFDLQGTPNLVALHLENCFDLVELHVPVECRKLESIHISGSKHLTFEGLRISRKLYLRECADLVELHIPIECLKLVSININTSKLRTLDLRGTPYIEELHLGECVDLVELHIPVECLKLVSININGSKLRTLDLRGTLNIEKLHLYKCVDLVEVQLPIESLKLVSININGSKLRTLDLRGTSNIEKLFLRECVDLVELHIPFECQKLISININLRTLDLRGTSNIEKLCVKRCADLVEIHIPFECLKLVSINIYGSKLRTLDIRGTLNIEKLFLKKCVIW
ncbi:LOW QUALITY PROTEIN: hypothetical protein OSB04_un001847 [Centaurea solstitialis]|uniref:TIR domain-containing protein n=1 Tax=Centaurea solstitialis TaxID=347529 RepID=A0AA38S3D7_9ASTR|nr:LOW QUALITY PROTEIN: hypothetical protein OSB04_un001847 [Centaurea solstitialis]